MVREHQELQLCDQQCVAARTEVEAPLWSQTPTWTFRKELGVGLSQGKLQDEANSHWAQSGKELKPIYYLWLKQSADSNSSSWYRIRYKGTATNLVSADAGKALWACADCCPGPGEILWGVVGRLPHPLLPKTSVTVSSPFWLYLRFPGRQQEAPPARMVSTPPILPSSQGASTVSRVCVAYKSH